MLVDQLVREGKEFFESCNFLAAEEKLFAALQITPDDADLWNMLGVIHLSDGRHENAAQDFSKAIKIEPSIADYHLNFGLAMLRLGDRLSASSAFKASIEQSTDRIKIIMQVSSILMEHGDYGHAYNFLKKATEINSAVADVWINLCGTCQSLKFYEEAMLAGERSILLAPNNHLAHYNLARTYGKVKHWMKAHKHYDLCVKVMPAYLDAYCNKAKIFIKQGLFDRAEHECVKALSYRSNYPEAMSTLALSLASQGRFHEAIPIYKSYLEFSPNDHKTRFNLAMSLLTTENFEEGWQRYEDGILSGKRDVNYYPNVEVWNGDTLRNKHLHIIGEQGIGEQIMFSTVLPDLKTSGASLSMEVDHRLTPIFSRSLADVTVVDRGLGSDILVEDSDSHRQIAAGSMIKFLRKKTEFFHPISSSLVPDAKRVSEIKSRYNKLGHGPKVGISWKTSSPIRTQLRCIPLRDWVPILSAFEGHFVSLQYGEVNTEVNDLHKLSGFDVHVDPFINQLESIEDSLAQIAAMDLVVSISNSTVHLAGSCGVRTLVMLEKAPHWHWFLNREDCLWYQNIEFFRQKEQGKWSEVIEETAIAASQWYKLIS